MPFIAKGFNSRAHEVHGTQGMMKAGMQCAGINQVRHAQLFNVTKPLKTGVFNQIVHQFRRDGDKSVNRVVNDLLFIQWAYNNANVSNYGKPCIFIC